MRHNRWAPIAVAVLALSNSGAVKAEPPRLIADLQPEPGAPRAAQPHGLTRAGARVFFAADDGYSGFEPWFFDESTGRARQLADVCPGRCSSEPDTFVGLGSLVLFRAWDSERGLQLWRSDGTPRGTYPLLALPGPAFGRLVQPMALAGDIAVLLAGSGSQAALYATDGSRAGTRKISDMAADGVLTPTRFFLSTGRQVFLLAGLSDGWHLWCSDGTELGTRDLASFPLEQQASLGAEFAVASPLGQDVLFLADDGVHGQELWRTDGTTSGTRMVGDLAPGAGSVLRGGLVSAGALVYLLGAPTGHLAVLWRSDGTAAGTFPLTPDPGFDPLAVEPLGPVEGPAGSRLLFFRGGELWSSGGTLATTQPIAAQLTPPVELDAAVVDGRSYFAASPGDSTGAASTCGLWRSDGTEPGTRQVGVLDATAPCNSVAVEALSDGVLARAPTAFNRPADPELLRVQADRIAAVPTFSLGARSSDPTSLIAWHRRLLFVATRDGAATLYRSDGTAAGTSPVPGAPVVPEISKPRDLTLLGGRLLFVTDRVRRWNGRDFAVLTDFSPIADENLRQLYPGILRAFFFESNGASPVVLWSTDGQPSGTHPVAPVFPPPFCACGLGPTSPEIRAAAVGDRLVFAAQHESRLWASDGTSGGTRPIADLASQSLGPSATVQEMVTVGSEIYVLALRYGGGAGSENGSRAELWRSDGSSAGTHLVWGTALRGRPPGELTAFGNAVYFHHDDGENGEELWRSDGTATGTAIVADIDPGARSSSPADLTVVGDQLFFTAAESAYGRELWTTDGTADGTRLVRDIAAGPAPSFVQALRAVDGALLFAASDGRHGVEPWISFGSTATTHSLGDIAQGPTSSEPREFVRAGPWVYFNAGAPALGYELFAVPATALAPLHGAVPEPVREPRRTSARPRPAGS